LAAVDPGGRVVIRDLTVRPIDVWPDGWRRPNTDRKPNPFKVRNYQDTVDLLGYELERLAASGAYLQVDIDMADIRRDGMPRAQAKVGHPGVILTVDSAKHGVLTYPCDTFAGRWSGDPPDWQINLRAIALGLEALRKVDRYGIAERGQQYAGFGALPAAGERLDGPMSVEQAIEFLRAESEWRGEFDPVCDTVHVDVAFRAASKRLHPDAGGDPARFRRLVQARDVLRWGAA